MDTRNTLHIRCGSDIHDSLKAAGFVGDFLEFADPFCQGPVLDCDFEPFFSGRVKFVVDAYGLNEGAVRQKSKLAYDGLEAVADYEHIVLWFEHDSYDQLILAYVLRALGRLARQSRIELVCVEDFPISPRFIGLGQLSPADLQQVWRDRVVVTADHFSLGANIFHALVQDQPAQLRGYALNGTHPIAAMRGAVRRHLQQLPDEVSGLSLTEELSLKALTGGPKTAGTLFRQLMFEDEPLPYLGDMMYWFELKPLLENGAIEATNPKANWLERDLQLTELGKRLLAGEADWLDHVKSSRWVGGIEIKPGERAWRRSIAHADLHFR